LGRGGGDASRSSGTPPAGTETPKAPVADSQAGNIHDTFIDLYKQVDQALTGEKLSQILEDTKNALPPGPVLHQLLAFAREMKNLGDKIIVGSLRDDVLNKLKDFKSKYS
jgi:hypothetical protein